MTAFYDPHADWAREDREAAAGPEQAIARALMEAVEAIEAVRPLLETVGASGMWDDLRTALRTVEGMHAWCEQNRGWTVAPV